METDEHKRVDEERLKSSKVLKKKKRTKDRVSKVDKDASE